MNLMIKRWKKKWNQRKENRRKNAEPRGKCNHCGGAWNWKEGATINYYNGTGMFPICKDCFNELTVKEVAKYCLKKWKRDLRRFQRSRYGYKESQRELGKKQFLERVVENIKRKKEGKTQKYGFKP